MKQIADFSFRHWKWIIGLSALLTLVSVYFVVQIRVDNSIETLSIDNDPKLLLLQQSEKTFGGNEFVVISFKGDDIFSTRVLSMINAITTDIEKIENVESVLSLTNAVIAKKDESGFGMDRLISEKAIEGKDSQAIKQNVISQRLYEKFLYSSDGNATSIIAWLVPLGKDDAARWRVVNAITDVLKTHKDDRKFYLYGLPVYQEIIYKIMIQDQIVLPMILSALMGLLLLLIFRNIWLVILPFGLIGITCLWTMGVFVMMGNTLDVVTFIITCVVLIVCLCDAIHILSEYRDTSQEGTSRIDHLKTVIARIGPPIMLTSLTTAVGFCSLAASGIRCTRNFGLYTGLGVVLALVVSLTLIPLAMSVLPIKTEGRQKNDRGLMAIEALLVRLAEWILNHKRRVSVATILVLVFCVTGALKLDANMKIFGLLKERHVRSIAEAQAFIDVALGGSAEFDVLLKDNCITTEIKRLK
ncbi:MAG: MMPL family transporter [Thermodesulfobacteriota bacterium]|nr:MMPL family transporter [Thermodesulfobacteriota bacterium]